MAIASILASGATDLAGADVTIADGASATFAIRMDQAFDQPLKRVARVFIQQKNSDGNYANIATLTVDNLSTNVIGPAVVRAYRTANAIGASFGCDQTT